jgi:hypothetical protein
MHQQNSEKTNLLNFNHLKNDSHSEMSLGVANPKKYNPSFVAVCVQMFAKNCVTF